MGGRIFVRSAPSFAKVKGGLNKLRCHKLVADDMGSVRLLAVHVLLVFSCGG